MREEDFTRHEKDDSFIHSFIGPSIRSSHLIVLGMLPGAGDTVAKQPSPHRCRVPSLGRMVGTQTVGHKFGKCQKEKYKVSQESVWGTDLVRRRSGNDVTFELR